MSKKRAAKKHGNTSHVWVFPTRSKCPACHSLNTHAYCTRPPKQHRVCRDCGARYQVGGRLLRQ